ncbi:MAG: ATP-binding protein [Caldisericota bacterium]|nr:ATP-binding protein [Caldisericota bacterium]
MEGVLTSRRLGCSLELQILAGRRMPAILNPDSLPDHGHCIPAPCGTDQTHLAVAPAEASLRAGLPACFQMANDLVSDLGKAYREGQLDWQVRV